MANNKSILQDEKCCFITGKYTGLHKHHIYNSSNRPISEKMGFFVWLTPELHNLSNEGVHSNKPFDMTLRKMCQRVYEDNLIHDEGYTREAAREKFMSLIGRNYLD